MHSLEHLNSWIAMKVATACCCILFCAPTAMAADVSGPLTIQIRDYVVMPMTGKLDGTSRGTANLARINMLHEEPGPSRNRFFVNDQNGMLYIIDKRTKQTIPYLDLNGRDGRKGIFHRFTIEPGFASGLFAFAFDPDYPHNGRFYTLHMEETSVAASSNPDNSSFSSLDVKSYQTTQPLHTPGQITREAVIVEWTDTNTGNTTFEGTARELLRIQQNNPIHPVDDIIFNPIARPGDADWRVMYISCGDNATGETQNSPLRQSPQRLDTIHGKILRIIPDLKEHIGTSKVSENGSYRVPDDNPFVSLAGARPEIWAYGLRNPHRLTWEVDPDDPKKNYLFANVIGLSHWETVVIVRKGTNYGYPAREGNQQLTDDDKMAPIPEDDRLPVRIGDRTTGELVRPVYPVIQYDHSSEGGDAMANGFVYHGKIRSLRGKFIFGDITTGRLWWADLKEMLAADDGDPKTMAPIHRLRIQWLSPGGNDETYTSMFPIASAAYQKRGGLTNPLPGGAPVSGRGRVDLRIAEDSAGELYLLSKSDGVIREVIGAVEH